MLCTKCSQVIPSSKVEVKEVEFIAYTIIAMEPSIAKQFLINIDTIQDIRTTVRAGSEKEVKLLSAISEHKYKYSKISTFLIS